MLVCILLDVSCSEATARLSTADGALQDARGQEQKLCEGLAVGRALLLQPGRAGQCLAWKSTPGFAVLTHFAKSLRAKDKIP